MAADPGSTVVDLGAGSGRFALAVAPRCAGVYRFDAAEAEERIEAWIMETTSADVEAGWTRAELAEHVRDEHSTFTWLLEPMIAQAGLDVVAAEHDPSGLFARYLCRKPG